MSALAPTLQAFFITRLDHQRQASPRTVTSYRDAFRLLLGYARARTGKEPAQLDFTDLDATFVSAFLDHLEHERNNSARTRNALSPRCVPSTALPPTGIPSTPSSSPRCLPSPRSAPTRRP